jgi:Uma2 family endonuclease
MATTAAKRGKESRPLDPEVVELLPRQGEWSEADYLWLTDHTNRLVEYTDGFIEVLPMPTKTHQAISRYLFLALLALMQQIGGDVYYAPLRVRVGPRKFREPDLLLVRSKDDPRAADRYWEGADLVLEVVSPDDPARDYEEKRTDYAQAGIPEYWIVDPQQETIIVLILGDGAYGEHGVFRRGDTATSVLFPDFEIDLNSVFDVA